MVKLYSDRFPLRPSICEPPSFPATTQGRIHGSTENYRCFHGSWDGTRGLQSLGMLSERESMVEHARVRLFRMLMDTVQPQCDDTALRL